jgi:hypothetical protein
VTADEEPDQREGDDVPREDDPREDERPAAPVRGLFDRVLWPDPARAFGLARLAAAATAHEREEREERERGASLLSTIAGRSAVAPPDPAAAERDPAHCSLHSIAIPPLPPRPPELIEEGEPAGDGWPAGRALDRAFEEEPRALAGVATRVVQGCPVESCARAARARDNPGLWLVLERHPDRESAVLRARCLRGCSPEAIGAALAEAIAHEEERLARMIRDERARQMGASVSLALLAESPPQEWIVDGLVSSDALTVLGGEPGGGKTFAAMGFGIAVATGRPFAGRRVVGGRVLLVLLEGSGGDLHRRIDQLARGMGTSIAELQGRLDVDRTPLRVDDPASVARLSALVRDHGYRLVAIDNLTEIRAGAAQNSENDATAMSAALRPLAELAHEHRCGVLVLHHLGASGRLRGSSAILGSADEELVVRRGGGGNGAVVTVAPTSKTRRGDARPLSYRLIDRDRDGRRSIVPEPADAPARDEDEADADEADADESPRARMLALCAPPGLGATELTVAMGGRAEHAVALRDQLRDEGAIEYRGGRKGRDGKVRGGRWVRAQE